MFLSSIPIASVSVLAGALGVISHLGYFIHGEHHMQSVRILCIFVLGPLIFFACNVFLCDFPIIEAGKATIVASTSYFVALTLSILSYRVFFHPLRHFPGPFSARLTKLTHVARLLPNSDNFAQAHQLHQKYGEIVRVGPNELTIINPDAIAAIHSSSSKCIKAPWYDAIGGPNPSLQLTRNRNTHDKRRKIWDQAFSARALRNYEGRVDGYVDQLIAQLDNLANQPVNASLWFNFYSFDVMGDLAFGKSFNMLKSGEKHFALKLLQDGMRPVGILTPIPWILPILLAIPGAGTGTKIFTKFIEDQAATRRKNTPLLPDITSWLLDAEENSPDPMNKNPRWLNGDTGLMIVAGSDTTAATLSHIFYHLALDSTLGTKLRNELRTTAPRDAKFLAALINETLRLHPPVPSGVLRQTPASGLVFGDTFIPGNVTISMPIWSLGRLEGAFPNPSSFVPERWTTSPELLKNKAAFMPFSTGPYSCVGKQLALLSLRTVVARLVQRFDIRFAANETGQSLLRDTKDVFTLDVAPLNLIFVKRDPV